MTRLATLPALHTFIHDHLHAGDDEHRAYAQNFQLEERLPTAHVELYAKHVGTTPVGDLDDWMSRHNHHVAEEVQVDLQQTSLPFRPDNHANRLDMIDKRIYLLHVDDAK